MKKKTFTLRTRFAKDIVAEFLPPIRRVRGKKPEKVLILCDGVPAVPSKRLLMDFFAKKGWWVFHPRYRGTWESGGRFLAQSPDKDILDIVRQLPEGFMETWGGKKFRIQPETICVMASSFGGATALMAARDSRITKVVAFSPVVDWKVDSRTEPLEELAQFIIRAFGDAYRGATAQSWAKLKKGKFFNPSAHAREIDGSKVLIIHAKDDRVVGWHPVRRFAEKTGAKFILLRRGGHLSLSAVLQPAFLRPVLSFLRK